MAWATVTAVVMATAMNITTVTARRQWAMTTVMSDDVGDDNRDSSGDSNSVSNGDS